MQFTWPLALWLLLLAPLLAAGYVAVLKRRKRAALVYSSLGLVRPALTKGGVWRRHLPPALLLAALVAALVAVARPTATILLPSEFTTLVLAMDVSRSMQATDVKPNRLIAAQQAAKSFIDQLPKKTRLAIVSFAGAAAIVQTPTESREDMHAAIDRFQLQRGTATGSGLLLALSVLFPDDGFDLEAAVFDAGFGRVGGRNAGLGTPLAPRAGEGDAAAAGKKDAGAAKPRREFKPVPPGSYTGGTIILLSDGRRTTGPDPLEIAKMAADRGVRVYTVGFGTNDGGEVSGFEGWSFYARLDEETLKAVARITGGEYFQASSGADLQKVYEKLNSRFALETRETEIGALFAAAAALLALAGALLSLAWFGRFAR
jgi:Ca-activated chloride channel family protein